MFHSSQDDAPVTYQLEQVPPPDGTALGVSSHAGLASFVTFVNQSDIWPALAARLRLPIQQRRTGFTHLQKRQALIVALATGCRRARDSDFALAPDPVAAAMLGLPRWPHSRHLTRHLRAFRPQHVAALRQALTAVVAQHAAARRRLRRGGRVVVDVDQTAISANGTTYQYTAKGHLTQKGERGYQATALFAGDTSGGQDEVLGLFLDPGNTRASRRLPDVLEVLEATLGSSRHLCGLILRFDAQYATADDLAQLSARGVRFVGRNYSSSTAAVWARALPAAACLVELTPNKWVCDLGVGPVAVSRPDVVCRRLLVRSTEVGQHAGYTAIVTNIPVDELSALDLEPFYEGRQTIEGWLSEATAAVQLKGLWSRSCSGVEAFLLHVARTSNLLHWWERRALLPDSALPHLGLRQLTSRVIAIPARVVPIAPGRLVLVVSAAHPYARHLVPRHGWQLPLPLDQWELVRCDAHF